jgi:lysozyme
LAHTPGIDVSRYEGDIDWKKVAAAGHKFAVLRATVGDYYTDPTFYTNYANARKAGLLVSMYHVVVANRYADKQIARFFSVIGSRKSNFPLILDIERDDNVSNAANTACIRDCISQIGKHDKRKPIIYTAKYYWKDHVLPVIDWSKYDLWVASYDKTPYLPPGWKTWRFWQYSDTGKVPGISGGCDMNYFNGTYAQLKSYCSGNTAAPAVTNALEARVSVARLNVRNGPSKSNTILGTLASGATLSVTNIAGSDVWVEFEPGKWLACNVGGKTFLQIIPGAKASDGIKVKVLVDKLNIRNGPSASYSSLGHYNTGKIVRAIGLSGKDVWVQADKGKWSAFFTGGVKFMEI